MKARAPAPAPLFEEGLTPAPLPKGDRQDARLSTGFGERGATPLPFSLGEKVADAVGRMRVFPRSAPSTGPRSSATSTPTAARSRPKLLSPETCRELAALYPDDPRFRSRIVMGAHGFGRGEYKYFANPLPEPIVALRRDFYPAARADRGSLERSDGRVRPLSGRARSLPRALS